ncbi:MAG: peptidoglycan-binding protein [Sulfuricaulis sp.]|nr:peptidoglycan-binding protein [Sulfuricaulis sp.]
MATAKKLLKIARRHLNERYMLGALAPKNNPAWSGPWDCAEFCSWCVYQATGKLFGCRPLRGHPDRADAYTGFWGEDAGKYGKIISVGQAAATPGAFLLRLPGGAIGHVAISVGDGSTIEAHSTKRGVIVGNVVPRRWDYGVLVPGIKVSVPAAPMPIAAPGIVLRLKSPRMTGRLIKDVQRALRDAGCNPGPLDAKYGPQTAAAVRAFQLQKGLAVDGEVGGLTARKLGVPLK